jgi:hypothetical protein
MFDLRPFQGSTVENRLSLSLSFQGKWDNPIPHTWETVISWRKLVSEKLSVRGGV